MYQSITKAEEVLISTWYYIPTLLILTLYFSSSSSYRSNFFPWNLPDLFAELHSDASKASLDKLDLLSQQVTAVSKGVESLRDQATSIAADFGDVQNKVSQASADVSALVSAQNGNSKFFLAPELCL